MANTTVYLRLLHLHLPSCQSLAKMQVCVAMVPCIWFVQVHPLCLAIVPRSLWLSFSHRLCPPSLPFFEIHVMQWPPREIQLMQTPWSMVVYGHHDNLCILCPIFSASNPSNNHAHIVGTNCQAFWRHIQHKKLVGGSSMRRAWQLFRSWGCGCVLWRFLWILCFGEPLPWFAQQMCFIACRARRNQNTDDTRKKVKSHNPHNRFWNMTKKHAQASPHTNVDSSTKHELVDHTCFTDNSVLAHNLFFHRTVFIQWLLWKQPHKQNLPEKSNQTLALSDLHSDRLAFTNAVVLKQ